MSARRPSARDAGRALLALSVAFVVWELAVRLSGAPALYAPPPSRIAARLAAEAAGGDLLADVGVTLRRLLVGFVLGGAPALVLGLAMGWSRRLRGWLDPLVAALHPIPKVTLLPLLILLLGVGEASRVALVALSAFFPLLIGAMAGVCQIHSQHFEVARNCLAGRALVLRRIVLPGSLPTTLAGARLAINAALLMTLVAELVIADDGLGERLWFAWQTLQVADLYGAIVVVALLGIAIQGALAIVESWLVPWRAPVADADRRTAAAAP